MAAFLRKDFVCLFLRNSSYLCESRVPFPSSFHQFYSKSAEKKPTINRTVYDFLLKKHHFSPEAAAAVAASAARELRNPEKSDSLLSFLKKTDFSNSHLEKILRYRPSFISVDLEKSVKPKIKIFQELGFSKSEIADFCARNPSLFFRRTDNSLIPALSNLRILLGSDANVVKLLMRCGWFLSYDLNKCVMPNIEFLKSHSISMDQIIKTMPTSPKFLLQSPKSLRRCAEEAEELGASPLSKMYIHAVKVRSTMSDEAWVLKLEAFRSLGFSEGDISKAFSKYPTAFAVSVKKMREVADVLVSTGKYNSASIVAYPLSLASSVEKRFKPRLQVLAALEGKGLIKKWPRLSSLCTKTDSAFFRDYVLPHIDEVGHLFTVKGPC